MRREVDLVYVYVICRIVIQIKYKHLQFGQGVHQLSDIQTNRLNEKNNISRLKWELLRRWI